MPVGDAAGGHADGKREAVRLQAECCGRRRSQEANKQTRLPNLPPSEMFFSVPFYLLFFAPSFTFGASQFLLPLVRRLVGSGASSQRLRDKFIEKRQRGVHLENNQSSSDVCMRHI